MTRPPLYDGISKPCSVSPHDETRALCRHVLMSRPVVGFGALSVDDILFVDAPFASGKGRIIGRARTFGGNVATGLVAVARLGGAASFIGWLDDAPSDPAVQDLQSNGVRIDDAPRAPGCKPIRSTITVAPDGERFIAFDDDVRIGTRPDLPDDILGAAGALLIDSYATTSLDIVRRARGLGIPVIADIEASRGPDTDALLALPDHLVLPLSFAREWTGKGAPADALAALWTNARAAVVLTDGERGAWLMEADGRPRHLPAHRVAAVDTTGAGDCFHGAYALALVEDRPVPDCVRFASAAAALSVGGRGGREALPDAAAVTALLSAPDAPDFRETN